MRIEITLNGGINMAKVSDVIFCLRATNTEGEGASASTILTALTPEYIPGLFTFSVIITLLDITPEENHTIVVDFLDPSKEKVVHIVSDIPQIEDDSNLPREYKGLNMAMDWNNVNLKMSGLYTICISFDGAVIQEKSIYVKGKNE